MKTDGGNSDLNNIVLVGMPGAGKSTVGVVLAKVIGYQFIDSDLLIQQREKKLLKDIIAEQGLDKFIQIEEDVNCSIDCQQCVIATGGSVVYGEKAMEHLRSIATIVYIKLSMSTLKKRLGDIKKRGVVLRKNQSFEELYMERCPLYEKYAHVVADAEGYNVEELMFVIKEKLKL
ncbi:shikimate kinase [Anaeromicropila populeti]|uniref:shikimate kinase n=1 Tax=Anaeromicropila populeti TaxID=37658 RepID=UPI002E8DD8AA|nr:shikimate kinase [Anaeromicropila populeti]